MTSFVDVHPFVGVAHVALYVSDSCIFRQYIANFPLIHGKIEFFFYISEQCKFKLEHSHSKVYTKIVPSMPLKVNVHLQPLYI